MRLWSIPARWADLVASACACAVAAMKAISASRTAHCIGSAVELPQGAPSVQRGPGLAAVRVAGVQGPVTSQSAQLSNMLTPEPELHRIIRPFSRIITSRFANGQQSLDRTRVIRTNIVMQRSFCHSIPHSHGNIGPLWWPAHIPMY